MAYLTAQWGLAPGVFGGLCPNRYRSGEIPRERTCDISQVGYNGGMDPRRPTGEAGQAQRYPSHHRVARRPEPAVSNDLRAALDARRDLGPEYEGELVAGFLDRLDEAVDARVDARLEQRGAGRPPARRGMDGSQLALAIVTTALGVPLTAITTAYGEAGVFAFVIVWAGIVLVNLAGALSRRH